MAIDTAGAEKLPSVERPNVRTREVRIDGIVFNATAVIGDDRGTILELIDLRQEYWADGVPYVYFGTTRPRRAKGWGMHKNHTDRYMLLSGEMVLVLFDDRDDSPTKGVVQEFYLTRDGLNQITIPPGIWHAHYNPGTVDLLFANAPSQPFRHEDPDKWRLALDDPRIPYTWRVEQLGW